MNCHIENIQRAMILNKTNNGNAHQVFTSKNTLGLHAKRTRVVLYVHKCVKVVVRVRENSFCTEQMTVRVSSDNSSEGIRYMDTNSKVLWKFIIASSNPLYPNALELQNGSWNLNLARQPKCVPVNQHDTQWHHACDCTTTH